MSDSKKGGEGDEAQQKVAETKEVFENVSEIVRSELRRFEQSKVEHLKEAIVQYIQANMNLEIRVRPLLLYLFAHNPCMPPYAFLVFEVRPSALVLSAPVPTVFASLRVRTHEASGGYGSCSYVVQLLDMWKHLLNRVQES